jgi:O-succinylhomoserine sulfhydrylase
MEAHSQRALALAQWLEQQPQVARVYYPACPATRSMRWQWRSSRGKGGAVVSFELRAADPGGRASAPSTSSTLTRIDARSQHQSGRHQDARVTHPASTSHGRLTEAQRQAAGVSRADPPRGGAGDIVPDLQGGSAHALGQL